MHSKFTLLGGAAVGAMLVLGVAGAADAKAVKHHHMAAAAGEDRIGALTSEVETLESRLEAETLAREQMQGQVQAAQTQAAAAQADADAAHQQLAAQIQTIPGVVSTAIASTKAKPGWADSTTVSGRVYADLSNINQGIDRLPNNNPSGTGFDIKRAYIGIDHKFNDIYSANITVDLAPNSVGTQTVSSGPTLAVAKGIQGQEALKKAYLQAKYSDLLTVRVGSADMPWIPFVEDVYGYRFVEKTLIDMPSFGNSADWGVFALGKMPLADKASVSYSVAAVDGAGYKNAIRSKNMDLEGRVSVNVGDFVAAVGGYTGKEASDVNQGAIVGPTAFHTATRLDALAAYTTKQFRVGVEYFSADNWKRVTKTTADKSDGYSVFGSFNFTPEISIFGRSDWINPNKTLASSEKVNYYNVGLNYEPSKIVDLALVYKHDALSGYPTAGGQAYSDANASFTGGGGHYDEVGLFTQFRF